MYIWSVFSALNRMTAVFVTDLPSRLTSVTDACGRGKSYCARGETRERDLSTAHRLWDYIFEIVNIVVYYYYHV